MRLCSRKECTGCMACFNTCKNKAISIIEDDEGFDYPYIDQLVCVKCRKCEESCPRQNNHENNNKEQLYYSAWTKNKTIRQQSSSGGIFSELAKEIIKKNGFVFGAAFDYQYTVHHIYINSIKNLYRLRGSKYVQSRIEKSYIQTKLFLDSNKLVLFSGTPCQIAGLKCYLRKEYENLITIDLICHGVPSPKIFNDYKRFIFNNKTVKINDFKFRNKYFSWQYYCVYISYIAVKKKKYIGTYLADPYIRGFLRNNYLRPVCYQCKYTNFNRTGDITLADYWNYIPLHKNDKNYKKKGVSVIIINTIKGKRILNDIKDKIITYEKSKEDIIKTNRCLYEPYPRPTTRDEFWKDYQTLEFKDIIKKWMHPEILSKEEKLKYFFYDSKVKYFYYFLKLMSINIIKRIFKVIFRPLYIRYRLIIDNLEKFNSNYDLINRELENYQKLLINQSINTPHPPIN